MNLFFNPEKCRNETEVESKLIVHYLLPKLGYPPHNWHQEVTFNKMRMDFLVVASGIVNRRSTVMLVLEAKHPRQKLDKHVRKFKRYLTSLNAHYGLLTNGKLVRVYRQINNELSLILQIQGHEVEEKIQEIKFLIGRDELNSSNIVASLIDFDHFEYNAFIKARELDPDLPDRIRVFIINDEDIQLTLEQLKTIENIRSAEKNVDNTVLLELGNIKSKMQSLEKNLSNSIHIESNQVRSEVLQKIQDLLPKPLPLLEAFNHISDPIVYSEIVKKIEFLGKKKAKKIADRLKEIKNPEHNKFRTFSDVLAEIGKGYISKEKMLDIIDNW